MEQLTEEDYASIIYFWIVKGDIRRWSEWEDRKGQFQYYHPELIEAMERLRVAKIMLNLVVDSFPPEKVIPAPDIV